MTHAEMLERLRCVERMDGSVPELERDRLFARVLIFLLEDWDAELEAEIREVAFHQLGVAAEAPAEKKKAFHRPKASVRVVEDDGA